MAGPRLSVSVDRFPIDGVFSISRGSRTESVVVVAEIRDGAHVGRGECTPYARYGESVDGVRADIEAYAGKIAAGLDRDGLIAEMPAGAARNALDCALWDLAAKKAGTSVAALVGVTPKPVETAFTISLADPATMAEHTAKAAHRPLLKIKLGGEGDPERLAAVRKAAPNATLIVDANEAWTASLYETNMRAAQDARVALVEQPLPADADEALRTLPRPVTVCADESCHDRHGLDALVGKYDAINIKLDKTGGLTEALALAHAARSLRFKVMVGCMLASSLAMAPAMLVAAGADFVDLDGPLLLKEDRVPGLRYEGSIAYPPEPALWG